MKCEWKYDHNYDYHETSCDNAHFFTHGNLVDNEYKYCPYCGKETVEVVTDE